MQVTKRNGSKENLDLDKINKYITICAEGLTEVSVSEVALDSSINFYNGIKTSEITQSLIMCCRGKIKKEPQYSYLAARLLLNSIYKDIFGESVDSDAFNCQYHKSFIINIKRLVKCGRVNPELIDKFDLKKVSKALDPSKDALFKYIGIQTLYDRYFLRDKDVVLETPQGFWMRVAMGLSLNEPNPTLSAIEIYNNLSNFYYCPSTPTLFNSGTTHSQLASCFLSTVDDSIDGIFGSLHAEANLSKYAGGLGTDVTPLRSTNSRINGTNGKSSGLIPWLYLKNAMLIAVNQSGKRKGSGAVYCQLWHKDIEDFLDLRKNTGDERRRAHDTNTAIWCSDIFFRYVSEEKDWYLFCPSEVPQLLKLYGQDFDIEYESLCQKADKGEISHIKIPSKQLWKKILISLKETGHPWITFKDTANERYSNSHEGLINSSNLCCVTGDQRVPTQKGILTVKELCEEGSPNIVVGRNGLEEASEMRLTITDAPILKITTTNGYTHKVTYDHPLWVKNIGWVEAKDLQIGDLVEIQSVEGLFGEESFEDIAFLMGLVGGDGTYGDTGVCVDIWEEQFDLIPEIESLIHKVISENSDKYVLKTTAIEYPIFKDAQVRKNGKLKKRLCSSVLRQILEHFDFNSENKTDFPVKLWKADKKTIASYIRGRYLTDGTIQITSQYTTSSICSTNYKFLQDLQIVYSNFGINSHINLAHKEGYRLLPDSDGNPKEYWCENTYRLCVTSKYCNKILEDNCQIFSDRGFQITNKKTIYKIDFTTEIKAVERVDNEDVYCLKVLSNPEKAWACNGLITKNTEIFLHTHPTTYNTDRSIKELGETAVCNLASINLSWITKEEIDNYILSGKEFTKLKKVVECAIRGLDNVVDLNFYPTPETDNSNKKHRPVGLGIMGFSGLLHRLKISYSSKEAVLLSDKLQEHIAYYAIMSSAKLAQEKGSYSTFEGSKWSKGILPIDTAINKEQSLDWDSVRDAVKLGMRNSNVMAIAPTATISSIQGCEQSIEPDYSILFVYSTMSGEFTVINEYFVAECKELGIWNDSLIQAIQLADGDISQIKNIPTELLERYKTAFHHNMFNLIDCASARQKWIDQGESFNIYYDGNSLKELSDIYLHAWKSKLKSTYYLRSKGATKIGKTSIETPVVEEEKTCRLDNPDCESCQ